eukprot:Selendium_serpulae@DN6490_c1_g1_i9.p1
MNIIVRNNIQLTTHVTTLRIENIGRRHMSSPEHTPPSSKDASLLRQTRFSTHFQRHRFVSKTSDKTIKLANPKQNAAITHHDFLTKAQCTTHSPVTYEDLIALTRHRKTQQNHLKPFHFSFITMTPST